MKLVLSVLCMHVCARMMMMLISSLRMLHREDFNSDVDNTEDTVQYSTVYDFSETVFVTKRFYWSTFDSNFIITCEEIAIRQQPQQQLLSWRRKQLYLIARSTIQK